MKKVYIGFVLLAAAVIFCFTYFKKKQTEIGIYPLSPYADSIKFEQDEDVSKERRDGIQIRFFLFDHDADYTQVAKDKMNAYITKYLRKEMRTHPAIYFTFYTSSSLDKDGHYTLAELNKDHMKDKFAEYEYINSKLFNFDFYKNGQYYVPTQTDDPNN